MTITGITLAGAIAVCVCVPAAMAQDVAEGTVSRINRLNGTVAIQQTPSGTVGANATATTLELKVQDSASLESVHAGDRVTFSVTESGGVKTITRIQRQKP